MKFIVVQRIFTVVFIIILILLFTLPCSLIHSTYNDVVTDIDGALSALDEDNFELAAHHAGKINELLSERSPKIKWFVNHGVVNEAVLEAVLAEKMCILEDREAAVAAFIALKSALNALDDIEYFDFNTFL
ncbi:MAG: DUF4363 family protein [Clostridia bacterium]|nr:DUF4363 family protein [Clostridia bacterium]